MLMRKSFLRGEAETNEAQWLKRTYWTIREEKMWKELGRLSRARGVEVLRPYPCLDTNMSLSARDTDHKAKAFSYTSLDLSQRSIRLLLLHPDRSESGHIECELRDATVDEDYVCLSYVWGQPDEGYTVTINGRPLRVRMNLYKFLQQARKKDLGWLWIDALCIDQENLAERTHQVQQMGSIYSRASRVISWLGPSPEMAGVLRNVALQHQRDNVRMDTDVKILFADEYWTRAWVTQEVILARQHTLMADGVTLPMKNLHPLLGPPNDPRHLIRLLQLQEVSPGYFEGMSLIHLLEEFPDESICLSSYTAAYFIPTGRICRKYGWNGDWYLALCAHPTPFRTVQR
ncbi:heterokaryon incompatibility protein-domain-containing protein [Alternaria alternata]|nr:heterokaryon incompatibility protein-domain-containing protein [Alternaria alternata]